MTPSGEQRQRQLATCARILDGLDDAVIATDEAYLVTLWNPAAERLYGWAGAEAMGRDVHEVAPSNPSARTLRHNHDRDARHGRVRTDLVAYRRDGSRMDVELTDVAMRDDGGTPIGHLGIHRDAHVRKRHEADQERLADILESIHDNFVAVDGLWRFGYVNNRALERIRLETGRPLEREDVVGTVAWEVFPELVGSPLHERLQQALEERRPVQLEAAFPRSGGWLEVRAYPLGDGLSIYARDIETRKRAEDELVRRAERQAAIATLGGEALEHDGLQALLERAGSLVADTLDVDYTKVAELLPGGRELLVRAGVGWREGVVGSEREPAGRGSQGGYTLLSREPVVAEDLPSERRFESKLAVRDHKAVSALTVVIGGAPRPFGVLGALSKTARSFSEDDVSFVQAVANVLATAAARDRWNTAVEEARETERRRIGHVLHDDALGDLADVLALAVEARAHAEEPLDDPLARLIPALKRVDEGIRGAIYDLGLRQHEDRPFGELLRGLVRLHRRLPFEGDVALELRSDSGAEVLGPSGSELLRILGEALTNARRHAAANTIQVRYLESEDGVHAEVSDDGVGFDTGTSLTAGRGLSRMRERSDRLGALLTIASERGSGTTVTVQLPCVPIGPAPESQPGVRVLLVLDHIAVREAIAVAFEDEPGFEVVGQAGSLREARELLVDVDVDVAVVDLGLPDGYGAELIKRLREGNPHAQTLVLSASLDRSQLARAVESGAAGALTKTAHLDEIVGAVRQLRDGATLLPLDEVVELLRFAGREREREHADRVAIARLTPREHDVLYALAEGLDSQAIAQRLHITPRTERNHVASILAKLGVHSQLQALVFALRYELVEVPPAGSTSP